jgi:glycosyltransferase involved in cell wall biosynthesis
METQSTPRLSVVVPLYNEVAHLRELLQYLLDAPCPVEREWIIVDDCSTDGSREILYELQSQIGLIVIEQETNRGKGAAIRRGIAAATGDVVMIQDADYEYDPNDVPALIAPILSGECDVVFGSRFKRSAVQVHRTYHFYVNRLLTILSNLLSGIYLTDMETCYKVMRTDFARAMNLKAERFGIEVEITAYVAKTRARVWELPIRYYPRTRLHGKKINWKDGVAALWHLVRFNWLVPADRAFTALPAHYRQDREHVSPRVLEARYALHRGRP